MDPSGADNQRGRAIPVGTSHGKASTHCAIQVHISSREGTAHQVSSVSFCGVGREIWTGSDGGAVGFRAVAAESPGGRASAPLSSDQIHHSSLERYAGNEAASTAHVFGFAAGHDVSIVTHNVDDGVATFFPGALL
jgi:hypothetical protein